MQWGWGLGFGVWVLRAENWGAGYERMGGSTVGIGENQGPA
jgi:hypothetical protein